MPLSAYPPPSAPVEVSPPGPMLTSPLLRIRAGIESGNVAEVRAGVAEADKMGVTLAPNVRQMITEWLAVNAPPMEPVAETGIQAPVVPLSSALAHGGLGPKPAPQGVPPRPDDDPQSDDEVKPGGGATGWSSHGDDGQPLMTAPLPVSQKQLAGFSHDDLRKALLKFFQGAPKGSDVAQGLGIIEGEEGVRFLPMTFLGRAVGLGDASDKEIAAAVMRVMVRAPAGVFMVSGDGKGAGLSEWAGWEEWTTSLKEISTSTRDPAFEPRSIQKHIARCARGAVRAGPLRYQDVLRDLKEQLSPTDVPEDAAPALRSAITRRSRLALACLVDAIAAAGLGPDAGPDSMGLVGQLPRTVFGMIFNDIDDRDRGACAFLAEVLQSWDRRRCFSKRWLQDAASKFPAPKGANAERDEGRGWYALTAVNLLKTDEDASANETKSREGRKRSMDDEDDESVAKHLEESRKRRAALMTKYTGAAQDR